jgi:cation transport regulator ChaC
MSGLWVFGYGSLVDPASFGQTLGRTLRPGIDFFQAEVDGFGRRWNYGVMHSTAVGPDAAGLTVEYTMIALGVVRSSGDSVNGVVGWVEEDELIELDRRERHYDRVDVTQAATVVGAEHNADGMQGSIVLYLPRREAIEHYERARDAGTAAIEQRYWDLVDAAFAAFGAESHARYRATTPAPDVPVLPLTRT